MIKRPPEQIDDSTAKARAEAWLKLIERSRDRAAAFPGKQCEPDAARPGTTPGLDIAVSEREVEYLKSLVGQSTSEFVLEDVAELQGFGTSRAFAGTEITLLYRRRLYVRIRNSQVTQITNCFQSMVARVATI